MKLYSPLGLNIFSCFFICTFLWRSWFPGISGTPEDENIRNLFSLQHELFFISLWEHNLERAVHCLKQYFESKKLMQREELFLMINAATKNTNLCWQHMKIMVKWDATESLDGEVGVDTICRCWVFLYWTYLTYFYW